MRQPEAHEYSRMQSAPRRQSGGVDRERLERFTRILCTDRRHNRLSALGEGDKEINNEECVSPRPTKMTLGDALGVAIGNGSQRSRPSSRRPRPSRCCRGRARGAAVACREAGGPQGPPGHHCIVLTVPRRVRIGYRIVLRLFRESRGTSLATIVHQL